MESAGKRIIIIATGVCIGVLVANIVSFFAGQAYLAFQLKMATKYLEEEIEAAKDKERAAFVKQLREERLQKEWAEYHRKENSNECKFWKQQNHTNPKAAEKIKQYCWQGPKPESI